MCRDTRQHAQPHVAHLARAQVEAHKLPQPPAKIPRAFDLMAAVVPDSTGGPVDCDCVLQRGIHRPDRRAWGSEDRRGCCGAGCGRRVPVEGEGEHALPGSGQAQVEVGVVRDCELRQERNRDCTCAGRAPAAREAGGRPAAWPSAGARSGRFPSEAHPGSAVLAASSWPTRSSDASSMTVAHPLCRRRRRRALPICPCRGRRHPGAAETAAGPRA